MSSSFWVGSCANKPFPERSNDTTRSVRRFIELILRRTKHLHSFAVDFCDVERVVDAVIHQMGKLQQFRSTPLSQYLPIRTDLEDLMHVSFRDEQLIAPEEQAVG